MNSNPQAAHPKLLVVEDDPDDRLFIRSALYSVCSKEVQVRFAGSGIDLMDYLRSLGGEHLPALIVLDLNLPRFDGRTILRELKGDLAFSAIPVVILSTSMAEEDVRFCLQHGADAYYPKPNSPKDLETVFNSLCSKYEIQ